MNYGFIIDNRKCIGCHACSTACKSENEVPLGVYRTWVKYTEVGRYPDVTRRFQVTRCNHCDNPPCVRICPVTAMYQRDDGIVDFDPNSCIGCKACMQACPYDSIYIDPSTNTAAKCHYCAHRVEQDLEPACVVVCPTHAIIAGDLENPTSEISKLIGKEKVAVRKPEQGTAPKLFYIDGDSHSLTPTAVNQTPESFIWADVVSDKKFSGPNYEQGDKSKSFLGFDIKVAKTQGLPSSGMVPSKPYEPAQGLAAEHMVQVSYTAQHKIPWHWPVPAYLVTKGLGSGVIFIMALLYALGITAFETTSFLWISTAALAFIGITTVFLVIDLERPERFLRIVFRPQLKSWLTRGAFLLIGFSNILGLWWLLEILASADLMNPVWLEYTRPIFYWVSIPLALGAAIYTAFLFAQAEGRDLWQSTSLPFHLFVQMLMAGAALLLMLGSFGAVPEDVASIAKNIFIGAVIADLAMQFFEFAMPHSSEIAARAAHEITGGEYKSHFWVFNILLGHVVVLGLAFTGSAGLLGLAGLIAMVGLYFYEYAFVMAPQRVPNS